MEGIIYQIKKNFLQILWNDLRIFISLKMIIIQKHSRCILRFNKRFKSKKLPKYESCKFGGADPIYFQGYLCRFMLVLLMYGNVAPVFWMFVEGKVGKKTTKRFVQAVLCKKEIITAGKYRFFF